VGRVDVQHMVSISGLLTLLYERCALVPSGNDDSQRHTVVRSALYHSHNLSASDRLHPRVRMQPHLGVGHGVLTGINATTSADCRPSLLVVVRVSVYLVWA